MSEQQIQPGDVVTIEDDPRQYVVWKVDGDCAELRSGGVVMWERTIKLTRIGGPELILPPDLWQELEYLREHHEQTHHASAKYDLLLDYLRGELVAIPPNCPVFAEIVRLRRLLRSTPKTADGVPLRSDMTVWTISDDKDSPDEFGKPVPVVVNVWDSCEVHLRKGEIGSDEEEAWYCYHNEVWSTEDVGKDANRANV